VNGITPEPPQSTMPPTQEAVPAQHGGAIFLRLLRVYRVMIFTVCSASALAAIAYAMIATPYYRAEIVVTPIKPDSATGLKGLANDVAGAIGVNLMQSSSEIETANAVLNSHYLIREFITRNALLPTLTPRGKRDFTLWFAVKRFGEHIVFIHNESKTGVTVVAMEWTDPVVAASWANSFVALANDLIRTRVLEESKRNIGYLNGQLAQTNDVEIKRAIYNLIESETKRAMVADGRVEYAFQVVDPAVAPEMRYSPKRTLIVMISTLIGLLASIGAAFFRDARRHQRLVEASS
jgi:uncharacterized protein involved in exopolysaccharide biosynthesis